ncbi:MAG: hypothetical protein HEP71_07990 [Roseivirga sp.]|nr:hypothetical protein [Roseivirga sp.]
MTINPRTISIILFSGFFLLSCGTDKKEQTVNEPDSVIAEYPDHVGDIAADAELDDPEFQPCQESRIPQYYALGANFRVPNKQLMDHFGTIDLSGQSDTGYFTIRFIVNCQGKVGRLREQSMTTDYQETELNEDLKQAIRNKLMEFNQWPTGRDFYQYLSFKIEQGQIREVLP